MDKKRPKLNFTPCAIIFIYSAKEILCSTYVKDEVLATPYPQTRYVVVVVFAQHNHGGKSILPELINTLEHTTNQVGRHEDELKLLGVLVLAVPDGVLLWVEVFPEERNGFRCDIIVTVAALECIKVPCAENRYKTQSTQFIEYNNYIPVKEMKRTKISR